MACAQCRPRLDVEADRGVCSTEAVQADLGDLFEVLSCTEDKYDSGTKWWTGSARCKACGQAVDFDYRCGSQNYGRVSLA